MVVPFPAGGPSDTLARILADRMSASLGQSIIIEDVNGASGSVGLGRVARAAPDGYTLSIGHWGTHVVIGATMNLSFDVLNDFEPVAILADTPIWLVARKDLPQKDLRELISWLKQNPDKALVGAVGVGGPSDLNGTYFANITGTKFQLVPYLGGGAAKSGFVGGSHRFHLGYGGEHLPLRAQRSTQGVRCHGEIALVGRTGSADHG
jgi:tripartite-type tricarboxylate transporter receptor subunit TctC